MKQTQKVVIINTDAEGNQTIEVIESEESK
jgi:hypothetical protein